jgi:hypothetical protein
MSVFTDILQRLGLLGPSGPPTPAVHSLTAWVPLDMTVDSFASVAAPWTYTKPAGTRDITAFKARVSPVFGALDVFGALQAASLLRPDPADAAKFQVNLTLRIEYPSPAGKPNDVAGSGKLPIVLINHGNHQNWQMTIAGGAITAVTPKNSFDGYAYLQDALAQNGIVSVSVDHNFACFTGGLIETRADTIIAALTELSAEEASAASRYHGRLDFTKIGLMGHSRGGDAVVRAAKKIVADPALSAQFKVQTVCSLAPTDFTGGDVPANRMFLDTADVNFYLVVYGALDGDVFGNGANSAAGTGFRHYDRARPQKAMVFLDNCCHNAFNTVWFADGNDSADPRLASDTDHQSVAVDYIGDLFRWQLKGENLPQRLDGRTANRPAQHASQQWMFGQTLKRIDDFENPAANLLGGPRTVTNPGGAPTTIDDFASINIAGSTLELHTAHQTHVLHCDLTLATASATRILVTDIPASDQDWSGLDTLILSLSGWFDPTSAGSITGANLPRTTITLTDAASTSSIVDFTVYGAALPSRPVFKTVAPLGNVTLMRLQTIPIALSSFAGVDLTKIDHLALDIVPDNDTHVFVDNIHAVKRQ